MNTAPELLPPLVSTFGIIKACFEPLAQPWLMDEEELMPDNQRSLLLLTDNQWFLVLLTEPHK